MTYRDLPRNVVDATKASILDTLACVVAGTACKDVVTIRALAEKWGGRPSSTVIVSRYLTAQLRAWEAVHT